MISLESFEASVLPEKHSDARFLKTRRLLVLRAGRGAPTEVRYAIGAATRLRFDAWVAAGAKAEASAADDPPGDELGDQLGDQPGEQPGDQPGRRAGGELRVLVDGREAAAVHLERGAPPTPLEIEVAGADAVALQLFNSGPSAQLLVYLDDAAAR
jgi:hypothetical protein